MNRTTDFEQVLRVHFDNHADPTVLDGQLDRIIDRMATVRQRPGWAIPERWLPMSAISERLNAAPRIPWRAAFAVVLLLLALVVSLILASGALRRSVPPPFGPAGNGLIAYADNGGAINVGDPVSGVTKMIVPGPGNDRPIFSPDGTRIAFLSAGAGGLKNIVVVHADGSGATTITTAPTSVEYLGWTPDSASVVAGNGDVIDLFDSTRAARPKRVTGFGDADSFNANLADLFQPPAGRTLLSLRTDSQQRPTLILSDPDGSNDRALIDATRSDYSFIYLGSAQWSPDGSMISFTGATRDVAEDYITYVMNADGSGLRPLSRSTRPINESNPAWSPDGTRIAVQRWVIHGPDDQERRPITVIDVQSGREIEVGIRPVNNGFEAWGWSPDGRSIIELPVPDMLIIADVATGKTRTIPWGVSSAPAWQRTAP